MSGAARDRLGGLSDAAIALLLAGLEPAACGVGLAALPGPALERWTGLLRGLLPAGMGWRRWTPGLDSATLVGGLDLAASLAAGGRVERPGLLEEVQGGMLLVSDAERLEPARAAHLAPLLDEGAAIGLVAVHHPGEAGPPALLAGRLGLLVELDERDPLRLPRCDLHRARARLARTRLPDRLLRAMCEASVALGVGSPRALLLAVRAARGIAALRGHLTLRTEDAALAARLVLAPRATRVPVAAGAPEPQQDAAGEDADDAAGGGEDAPEDATEDATPGAGQGTRDGETPRGGSEEGASGEAELLIDAAAARLPALLASPARSVPVRQVAGSGASGAAGAGAAQPSWRRGRPLGARRGRLGRGRLHLVETLRAAAPWQALRRTRAEQGGAARGGERRLVLSGSDIRLQRFAERLRATTLFAVDASGSAARQRLAEAKGAIELVLAECYIRRDRVALVAFRGSAAELLLPPTASLTRARRSLAGLPGGGGTPLAAGLDACSLLLEQLRRRGEAASLIVLTDGRANIGRDGQPGRARAEADALDGARRLRASGAALTLVDIAPRPGEAGRKLAAAMGGAYVALPQADARSLSRLAARGGAGAA